MKVILGEACKGAEAVGLGMIGQSGQYGKGCRQTSGFKMEGGGKDLAVWVVVVSEGG
ncbi:MAG: hypothetical protein OXQ89_18925 [Rhodospirillaceae bacterium]|nr:hypothetical protein [Rhodospirillaceae bacterium]